MNRSPEEIVASLEREIAYLEHEMDRLAEEYRPLEELYYSYSTQAESMQKQLDYYKKVYNNEQ